MKKILILSAVLVSTFAFANYSLAQIKKHQDDINPASAADLAKYAPGYNVPGYHPPTGPRFPGGYHVPGYGRH